MSGNCELCGHEPGASVPYPKWELIDAYRSTIAELSRIRGERDRLRLEMRLLRDPMPDDMIEQASIVCGCFLESGDMTSD